MIKTKKGLRQKNKLTGLADTEPSVSADFTTKQNVPNICNSLIDESL